MSEYIALHIEDDDASAYLFRAALEELRCSVAVFRVSDGAAGLAFLRRYGTYQDAPRPDIIVVDLNLPKVNGFEVLAALQTDPSLRSIPAIVLTTSEQDSDRQKAEAAGSKKYVIKPFDYHVLQSELSAIYAEFLRPLSSRRSHGDEPDY